MIKNLLDKKQNIYLDGAMGTNLMKINNKRLANMEIFSFSNPESVKKVHKDYLLAGSDVILTNTFGCNPIRLSGTNISPKEAILRGINIAQDAVSSINDEGKKYIALDIGPIGKNIDDKNITSNDVYDMFAMQAKLGTENGCDLIFIETMYNLNELIIAIKASKDNSNLPIFASFILGKDMKLYSGEDISLIVNTLQNLHVDAIGVNCSFGSFDSIKIMSEIMKLASVPLICKPNAGMVIKDSDSHEINSAEFSNHMKKVNEMGVNILGGCCGTDSNYIKDMIAVCGK